MGTSERNTSCPCHAHTPHGDWISTRLPALQVSSSRLTVTPCRTSPYIPVHTAGVCAQRRNEKMRSRDEDRRIPELFSNATTKKKNVEETVILRLSESSCCSNRVERESKHHLFPHYLILSHDNNNDNGQRYESGSFHDQQQN